MEISEGGENWELGRGHETYWPWLGNREKTRPSLNLGASWASSGEGIPDRGDKWGSSSWDWVGGGVGVVHCLYRIPRANTPHPPPLAPLISLLTPGPRDL